MPNQAMLDALGIDAATAQQYIDYVNSQAKRGGTSGGEPIIVNGSAYADIADMSGLSSAAADVLARFSRAGSTNNITGNYEIIVDAILNDTITAPEAAFIAQAIGLGDGTKDWAKTLYGIIGKPWPYSD